MTTDVKSWANKFKNLTDNDETIQCMGKYYTCTFMYDMGDRKIISIDVEPLYCSDPLYRQSSKNFYTDSVTS